MGMVACFAGIDLATILRLKANPSEVEEFIYPDDGDSEPENYIDLDKAWHCIHFMLTGSVDDNSGPLGSAVLGGVEIGDDCGYGPARIIEPKQVDIIATALASIDENNFKSRYAPDAMQAADVYLADMCVRDGNDALEYIVQNYHNLTAFYRDAARRGDGAILWLC